MAVTTSTLTDLYADIVADLVPYYDNAVLLPNPSLIVNSYNIEGSVGNQIKIPVTNSWTTGNSSIAENTSITENAAEDFDPSNVSLTVSKRAAGSRVSTESLEDGGLSVVSNATTTRLARAIAQNTDIAGFRVMLTGAETALTDISDVSAGVGKDGYANTALTGADLAVVFSPEAGAYGVKRSPSVKMFEDIDTDSVEFVATLRNGFAQVKTDFIRSIATSNVIGAASNISASLDQFSTSVANLRNVNAPTTAGGFYIACVTPGQELALAKELNGVGGISSGSIGSVAQMAANDALMQGLISYAIGCQFVRSNNLPRDLATA